MVISLRHFVITIIAIFLALGVGIFIGAIMDSQQLFISQQKQLVLDIEDEFNDFKQKNFELMNEIENLKNENSKNEVFIDSIYKYLLVKNSLEGLNILTINLTDQQNFEDVINMLHDSGANKISQLLIKDSVYDDIHVETMVDNGERAIGNDNRDSYQEKDLASVLRDILSNKSYNYFFDNKIDLTNENSQIDYIVIFDGAFKEDSYEREIVTSSIIEVIKEYNVPFIAVEKVRSESSSIEFYKELGVSTVDNIDTKLGKISMLMLINGIEGNYGVKETADKLMPENFLVFD